MKKVFRGLLGFALLVPGVAGACIGEQNFDTGYGYDMMGYDGWHGGTAFWFFGVSIHLLLIVIGVLTAVWLWQQITKHK